MTNDDEKFLRRAVELASMAGASGERPFGSLLVGADGTVLVEDHNTVVSDSDITAHPELKLARWAARELAPDVAAGTTMFTSCQPCPMCETAIARSGLGRVVFALSVEQFEEVKPATPLLPPVRYEGPALFDEARRPIEDYY
ncbi:nucleoside deaminase [Micromonospora chersina]|uniref:nucleoside deaminase n=1 Tax=Micromonospora chersina TaxID=47854 RepID=UPI00371239A3